MESDSGAMGSDSGVDPTLASPAGVSASDGSSPEQVELTWDAVNGATGYRVYRDGRMIAEVSVPEYSDSGAASSTPPAPGDLAATQGTESEAIELTWSAVTPSAGPPHTYFVTATRDRAESAPSASDTGHRGAATITSYELSSDGGETFKDVGLVTAYADADAPAAVIMPGMASASAGTSRSHVALSLVGPSVAPGAARVYLVRAVNAAGTGATSAPSIGHRGAGALSFQWQRSGSDSDAGYEDLAGATSPTHHDAGAPQSGEARFYRCTVRASGVLPVHSNAVRGFRHHGPSEVPRDDIWITNGSVSSLAMGTDVVYLGGNFSYVGPPTGAFAALDAETGAADLGRARVMGTVYAVEPDGSGGFYIGGSFDAVDGSPHRNLAHFTATGLLDPSFAPMPNGTVDDIDVSNGVLYVAGRFTSIQGRARNRLAAFDTTTGALTAWNPNADAAVLALAATATVVYVGGEFNYVGGSARFRVAAIDAATGFATPWQLGLDGTHVDSIEVSGNTVYLAGYFFNIGDHIAAVDATTGVPTAFSANANANDRVYEIAVHDGVVYAGGAFTTIGGAGRSRIACLDATTGTATAWNPGGLGATAVYSIAVDNGTVYAGGQIFAVNNRSRGRLVAINAASGSVTAWSPDAGNIVYDLSTDNDMVYA